MLPCKLLTYLKKAQNGYFLQLLLLWQLWWNCSSSFLVLSLTKMFWQDFLGYIRNAIYNECVLFWKDVVLGFVDYAQSKKVNFMLFIWSFYLLNSTFINLNAKPLLVKEFEKYIFSIKFSENKKALKTLSICNYFPFFSVM